jgi:hypothetical protein
MSHLKEPVVVTFTVFDLNNNDYALIFNAPFLFTFNERFLGSYGWIPTANLPTTDVLYIIKNETTNTAIGRMDILASTGEFIFNTTNSLPIFVSADDVITIKSAATQSIGVFGVSLIGER